MESGTCGFCGIGGGWLGEQGDEGTQILSSTVRKGESGEWTYERHPNALDNDHQFIMWCGYCIRGLIHKYQRYDDTNLRAALLSSQLRLELDGLRWTLWEATTEEAVAVRRYKDDPSIHLDKLNIERNLHDMRSEMSRRYGLDLTEQDWRP